jgi:nucleoid-associated protein EbfC
MSKKIKKKGTSRFGAGGGIAGAGGGQAGMMSQFQKMQQDMMKAQDELANESVDVTVGGGAISITITGHQRIQAIKIDKASLDLEDEEWLEDLQDLLVAAFNQAVEQSQALSAERMEGITGDLGGMLPPGLDGLLG